MKRMLGRKVVKELLWLVWNDDGGLVVNNEAGSLSICVCAPLVVNAMSLTTVWASFVVDGSLLTSVWAPFVVKVAASLEMLPKSREID